MLAYIAKYVGDVKLSAYNDDVIFCRPIVDHALKSKIYMSAWEKSRGLWTKIMYKKHEFILGNKFLAQ